MAPIDPREIKDLVVGAGWINHFLADDRTDPWPKELFTLGS